MGKQSRSKKTAAVDAAAVTPAAESVPAEALHVGRGLGARRVLAIVLLVEGVLLWWTGGEGRTNGAGAVIAAVVAGIIGVAVAVVPATRERVRRVVDRIRAPSPKA